DTPPAPTLSLHDALPICTLFTSLQQAFVNLRSGRAGKLPRPIRPAEMESRLGPAERAMLDQALACSVVGDPQAVRAGLKAFIERSEEHTSELQSRENLVC